MPCYNSKQQIVIMKELAKIHSSLSNISYHTETRLQIASHKQGPLLIENWTQTGVLQSQASSCQYERVAKFHQNV